MAPGTFSVHQRSILMANLAKPPPSTPFIQSVSASTEAIAKQGKRVLSPTFFDRFVPLAIRTAVVLGASKTISTGFKQGEDREAYL